MTYSISLDINEHLKSKYPKLTQEQSIALAKDVTNSWDYQSLIDEVDFKVQQSAYYANIELGEDNDTNPFYGQVYEPMEHTSEGC